jgi:hypothetical protein
MALFIILLGGAATVATASASSVTCTSYCMSLDSGVLPGDSGFIAHGSAGGVTRIPASGGGGSGSGGGAGALVEYEYRPACSEVCATRDFAEADAACVGRGGEYYYTASRPVGAAEWTIAEEITCLTPEQLLAYSPAQLMAYVNDYFKRLPLPEPGLHVAPSDNAVVNLPEIVSADQPVQTSWVVNEPPFPQITINASVRWVWSFGDGTTLTTSTPGRPFSEADPDIGNYLTHTYRQAKDSYTLSVTAVWTATYTVEGQADVFEVDGTVERTSSLQLRAADYAGVLTGN